MLSVILLALAIGSPPPTRISPEALLVLLSPLIGLMIDRQVKVRRQRDVIVRRHNEWKRGGRY